MHRSGCQSATHPLPVGRAPGMRVLFVRSVTARSVFLNIAMHTGPVLAIQAKTKTQALTSRESHSRTYDGSLDNFGYSGQAALYAEFRPSYPKSLINAIDEIDLPSSNLYVDACCGSGQLLCKIAPRFNEALGVDR